MGSIGVDVGAVRSIPREELLELLGERPPLPMEPIILDSEEGNSGKDTKSTDEKSTK